METCAASWALRDTVRSGGLAPVSRDSYSAAADGVPVYWAALWGGEAGVGIWCWERRLLQGFGGLGGRQPQDPDPLPLPLTSSSEHFLIGALLGHLGAVPVGTGCPALCQQS